MAIVSLGGLQPIVQSAAAAADQLSSGDRVGPRTYELYEELGAQCSRSLRNLSVNSKNYYIIYIYIYIS